MKAHTNELQEAFKIIDSVPANDVLDSSLLVRMRLSGDKFSLALTGSLRAEAYITTPNLGGKWTVYIDRVPLKHFLATAKDPETEISVKDKITLRSGQRLEQALHAPVSGYETWTPRSTFDLTADQTQILKTAVKYLPKIAGTENVDAVLFSPDLILVTDTLIMMAVTGSVVNRGKFYMPPDVARFLAATPAKVAVDADGVGAALSGGFVFQARSAHLDNYPTDKCRTWIEEGVKAPAQTRFKVSEFLESLRICSTFLTDKSEAVKIENKDNNKLLMTVNSRTGSFQRTALVTATNKMTAPANLPARRVIPWLEFALSIDKDCEVIYTKLPSASVFRFKDDVRSHTLLVADM
jgi:hypothetical protein